MTSSTTLMTFLVKTPPSTRFVQLFGSWDNFSKPYPMKRDVRLGAEHWTGCHNFENIICDGDVEKASGPRQGGLKMGGKYWYYYQLDHDVEFHNPTEPSTTCCPMLPGQVVNVLNVPIHLSSGQNRKRNASISSTSSELRTMNPEEKYMNPRPAPKPALGPLNTSLHQKSAPNFEGLPSRLLPAPGQSLHGRNASLPSSAVSLRSFRLPRKVLVDARGRSVSPAHLRPTGLRAAFRQLAPTKATSPEAKIGRGRARFPVSHREQLSLDQARRSKRAASESLDKPVSGVSSRLSSRSRSPTPVAEHDLRQPHTQTLALRRSIENIDNAEPAFSVPSFQSHRRQRSRSREPLTLRNSSNGPEQPRGEKSPQDAYFPKYKPLEMLTEIASAQSTPLGPSSPTENRADEPTVAKLISEASNKFLPTLPNTAPSANLSDVNSRTLQRDSPKSLEGIRHSLSKVIVSDEDPSSSDRSHFSHWTGTTISSFSSSQWSSVFLDGKSPSFSQGIGPLSQPTSPWQRTSTTQKPNDVKRRRSTTIVDVNRMPSVISSSTISSYDNTSPSSPASETSDSLHVPRDEPTSLQKRYGMLLGTFQGYKLPLDAQTSGSFDEGHLSYAPGGPQKPYSDHAGSTSLRNAATEDFPRTTTMQQLMHELSYLGDMIQE